MAKKALIDYLQEPPSGWTASLEAYAEEPASAFLTEAVNISDAMNHCVRHFPGKKVATDQYTKDSQESLHRLGAASHAALMGHFETFQRFLFAGIFEASKWHTGFEPTECIKRLERDSNLVINLHGLTAYRGERASVGQLVADSLSGWHDPARVNTHFSALVADVQFFSKADIEELRLLWQLRHSIVHTAAWLTLPDAQKHKALRQRGGRALILAETFTLAVVRKLHPLVKAATTRLGTKFTASLAPDIPKSDDTKIKNLFRVKSPRKSYFGKTAP